VANRVNSLSNALDKGTGGPPLSEAQVAALGGLAKLVAAQVLGAMVAKALERDAPTIGRALILQERTLKLAGDDIREHLAKSNDRFYLTKVKDALPKRRTSIPIGSTTAAAVSPGARARPNRNRGVNSAEVAARQMQIVWQRILSGEYSAKELTAMLKDTEDLLDCRERAERTPTRRSRPGCAPTHRHAEDRMATGQRRSKPTNASWPTDRRRHPERRPSPRAAPVTRSAPVATIGACRRAGKPVSWTACATSSLSCRRRKDRLLLIDPNKLDDAAHADWSDQIFQLSRAINKLRNVLLELLSTEFAAELPALQEATGAVVP
jgi:hypothetical protein